MNSNTALLPVSRQRSKCLVHFFGLFWVANLAKLPSSLEETPIFFEHQFVVIQIEGIDPHDWHLEISAQFVFQRVKPPLFLVLVLRTVKFDYEKYIAI